MPRSTSHAHLAVLTSPLVLFAFANVAGADTQVATSEPSAPAAKASSAIAGATTDNVVAASTADAPDAPLEVRAAVAEPAARYPRSVIARNLTLPSGLLAAGADTSGNNDLSTVTEAPIIGYGITDKLEVQVPYSFGARDFKARGTALVDVGYSFVRGALGGKLEVVARVRGGYNALDSAAAPILVEAHVQYNVTPRLAVISGVPGTQQLRISLAQDEDMHTPVDLSLPLGIGVQPTDTVYVQLDTKLVQVALSDSKNAVIGKDATPLTLTAVWNVVPAVDVQAAVGTDVNDPADSLSFLVGARYYAGRL